MCLESINHKFILVEANELLNAYPIFWHEQVFGKEMVIFRFSNIFLRLGVDHFLHIKIFYIDSNVFPEI